MECSQVRIGYKWMKYTLEIRIAQDQVIASAIDENGNRRDESHPYTKKWLTAMANLDFQTLGTMFIHGLEQFRAQLPPRSQVQLIQLHDNTDGWAFLDQNDATLASGVLSGAQVPVAQGYLRALRLNGIAGQLEAKAGVTFTENLPLLAVLWLKNEQPHLFEQMARFCSLQEYLHQIFTGEDQITTHLAARTGLYDLNHAKWDPQALALVNLTVDQLPQVVTADKFASQIIPEMVEKLGLLKDTQIRW